VTHLARFVGDGNGDGTTRLEPVGDEEYQAALARTAERPLGAAISWCSSAVHIM